MKRHGETRGDVEKCREKCSDMERHEETWRDGKNRKIEMWTDVNLQV